jgi:hypothetical protein
MANAEEEEAPESAVSSPPMEMDDPGTPGHRGIEVNFVGSQSRAGLSRVSEILLDANYGIGDRIQLKYERPYVTVQEEEIPFQKGVGATEFGVKWRMIDHGGLGIAVYPNYQLDDAFTVKNAEGETEETEGSSVYLPLLISKEVSHFYTLAANVGYRRNLVGRGDDINLALGVGRALPGDSRILAEVFSERDESLQNRQTDVRIGYVFNMLPQSWVPQDMEFPAYVSLGHSIGATESLEPALSFTFGVSIIKLPAH